MEQLIRIGLDTSKRFFQLHGVDAAERPVLRRQLRRSEVIGFFSRLAPTLVALEACGASHYWARELRALGHDARLIAPQLAKPYVKRGKNDSADAQAVCEAASRPTMRFVAVKSAGQQAALMLAGQRERLVRQRVQLANTIRGHAAEFGIVAAKGRAQIPALLQRVQRDEVPELARARFADLADEYAGLEARIANIDARLKAWYKDNETARRLADITWRRTVDRLASGDEDTRFSSLPLGARLCRLARADAARSLDRRQGAARPHHARRRRDAAQSFGGRRHGDDLADPARRRTPGFVTPSLALAPRVIAAQAGKTRGSRARQQDCAHRLEADDERRTLCRRAAACGDRLNPTPRHEAASREAAPNLASEGADGLIVRSVTGDTPRNPVADKAASSDWNSRRGNHLGQRRSPHQQAGHMDASERQLKKSARSTCKSAAVHTWIASSPG